MNKDQKKDVTTSIATLQGMRYTLDTLKENLDVLHEQLTDKFDNMTERAQESERGEKLSEMLEQLDSARMYCEEGNVSEALDALENLANL